jgi:hypothetical protein
MYICFVSNERSFLSSEAFLLIAIFIQVVVIEIGRTCSMYGKDLDVGGKIILKRIFERYNGEVWIGLIWLKIDTSGGLL